MLLCLLTFLFGSCQKYFDFKPTDRPDLDSELVRVSLIECSFGAEPI